MKALATLVTATLMLAGTSPVLAEASSTSSASVPPAADAGAAAAAGAASGNVQPGSTAGAQPGGAMVTATNPQSVLDALSAAGYVGKFAPMDNGRQSISLKISGLNTFIDFYDCADDYTDCYTLLFNVSLDFKDGSTEQQANDWNSQQITGRVWLDKNNDPTLDFSLSTFGGISQDVFEQNVKLWDTKIGDFKDAFHF